jgi:hypothetical protein
LTLRKDVHKVYQDCCCQLTGEEARKITVFDYNTFKDPDEIEVMKQNLRDYLDNPEASTYMYSYVIQYFERDNAMRNGGLLSIKG